MRKTKRYEHLMFIEFLFVISDLNGTFVSGTVDDCTRNNATMTCEHEIPIALPSNIAAVIVKDYLQDRINNESFLHKSWSFIHTLDITINYAVGFRLHDQNFTPLKRLQHLGLHSPFYKFNNLTHVLEGLSNLQTLNLSSCYYLTATAVIKLLNTVRYLDKLVLDQVATSGERFLILDDKFVKLIRRLKTRTISMSGCNLAIKGPLQVTNVSLNVYDIDVSNTSITIRNNVLINKATLDSLFPKVRNLDISMLQTRFTNVDYSFLENNNYNKQCTEENGLLHLFLRLEHLKINRVLPKAITANNSFIDLTECKVNLRTLQLKSNHIHYLNITVEWPEDMNLFHIDLSTNDVIYLSPSFLASVTSLEILNLSDNKLHFMESLSELKYMFVNHRNLEHLNISKNGFNVLPSALFSHNYNLLSLDLSYNSLRSISFDLKHLTKLQHINLRHNQIYFIDSQVLGMLKAFIEERKSKYITILFENNPFICTCKSLPFIKWLHERMSIKKEQTGNLTCSLNGDNLNAIDHSVMKKVQFSCIQPIIVTASISTGLVLFIIVSTGISVLMNKKRQEKKKRKKRNFLQEFKFGNTPEKYLCFMSYSSDDDDGEIGKVIGCIRESLKELTHIDTEVLCDSNGHFQPGFPIIDEIIRCIVESYVGIFFVTNNFCQSQWCQLELRETYELNKPIILIFKGKIDIRNMSPLMLKIFRQYTRAKIVINADGQIQMIPDFRQLSNSILKLASSRFGVDGV